MYMYQDEILILGMALILKTKQGSNSFMIQARTFGPEFPGIRQFTRNPMNGKVNKKIKN